MRTQGELHSEEAEKVFRDIRRATRRQYSAKEKVRIVIAGLRGDPTPVDGPTFQRELAACKGKTAAGAGGR
jgi:hypothetical protein